MDAFRGFLSIKHFSGCFNANRWQGHGIVMIFEGCGLMAFSLIFPVMIDEVIPCDANNPRFECPRFWAIQMECSINLQENLLRQILSLIGSSGKAVSQVVDPGVAMPDDDLPGITVAASAPRY